MTSQTVKSAIERTIKLNQGAAYIWSAVASIDTPSQDTIVFHLKYAAPLDLNASADYAAYIFDTKASGSQSLSKWFAAGHDAGTGPYTVQTWNSGQETELVLAASRSTGEGGAPPITSASYSGSFRRIRRPRNCSRRARSASWSSSPRRCGRR